jgi:hypothetical protein
MDILSLLVPMALAFLTGIVFLGYLVVHPLRMSLYLAVTCFLVSSIFCSLWFGFSFNVLDAAIASCMVIVSFLIGYSLMTRGVLATKENRFIPRISRLKDDKGFGHTAIVYFTHGEPETYTPQSWINQFREFDKQGISFVPWLARPFFLYGLRQRYMRAGKSDHKLMHILRLRDLEQIYRKMGDESTRFYISFLDDNPQPDAAVIQALNEGASKIILSEVFVTVSNHTREGEELVEALDVPKYGVDLLYTGPLWDSVTLQHMFVDRANIVIGNSQKSKVGVLLVGHGQPDEWDQEWPTETQQEQEFRHRILNQFEQNGYSPINLSVAWMEFKEPKPASVIKTLIANGVEKILFYSACISADAIHSVCDVPDLVYAAKIPANIPMINMGAWDNHPLTIQAIKEKIDTVNLRGCPSVHEL